jgi:HSP20 family molecular chaperone IbpA
MNENTEMKAPEAREMEPRDQPEVVLSPPVDICEDEQGITLTADLPGVTRERLTIQVDKDTLAIEGEVSIEAPEGMEMRYAEVRATRYRRGFTLSRELEADKISAAMKDGVLTLRIPKRAELQPRRIEVAVD